MTAIIENRQLPLKIVDVNHLDESYRELLRPGDLFADREGNGHRLPRFFYEIDSWKAALELKLTSHFSLWEFINIDVRESELMRTFPRYVPCAVTMLAAHLEVFRAEVGTYVHIAANGGYRSPAHALSRHASAHNWATAVNIYRIGNDYLDDREKIDRYSAIASAVLPAIWSRPYGHSVGYADDHLHLDLGYTTVCPRGLSE